VSAHAGGVVTHLGFIAVYRKNIATMGMKETRWRAHLAKVGRELMILEFIEYDWGVNVIVVIVVDVRHFPLVHWANSRGMGSGRKGGDGAWKGEIVRIEGEGDVLLVTRHVWVVCWVEHG
jgi:hypothetical protein